MKHDQWTSAPRQKIHELVRLQNLHSSFYTQVCSLSNQLPPAIENEGHLPSCHPRSLKALLHLTYPIHAACPYDMEVITLLCTFFHKIRTELTSTVDRDCSPTSKLFQVLYPPDWWMMAVLGTNQLCHFLTHIQWRAVCVINVTLVVISITKWKESQ